MFSRYAATLHIRTNDAAGKVIPYRSAPVDH